MVSFWADTEQTFYWMAKTKTEIKNLRIHYVTKA